MTTRYRVEYALKTHRRDQFIEWIKGLLATPFVLLSQPTAITASDKPTVESMAHNAHARYSQIFQDVEDLIADHITHSLTSSLPSKLKLLVPSVGTFFTPLPLQDAFAYQDTKRRISSRRFVAPSFNDIRLILNTAQALSLIRHSSLRLLTFDGDVTLYDDGANLSPTNPCIPRLLSLLSAGKKIAIVTAAGYPTAQKYHDRLHGLLDALATSPHPSQFDNNLVIMGGESNFLFTFSSSSAPTYLLPVPAPKWHLPEMTTWTEQNITSLLDVAESALRHSADILAMPVTLIRKERAVGIIPADPSTKLSREQLEETVLVVQRMVETSEIGKQIPFCAFNGGNDVFVDIGDKSWGVRACQEYFGRITGGQSLHVGDQFLSAGANDFKARQASATCWIASPGETVALLDEIALFEEDFKREGRT